VPIAGPSALNGTATGSDTAPTSAPAGADAAPASSSSHAAPPAQELPAHFQHIDTLPPLAPSTNPLYPGAIMKRPPNTHAKTAQGGGAGARRESTSASAHMQVDTSVGDGSGVGAVETPSAGAGSGAGAGAKGGRTSMSRGGASVSEAEPCVLVSVTQG
jgi:hypothetical protein